jgi:hypothetical protein
MNTSKSRRTTANLPTSLLKDAMSVTGKGITETLVLGLQLVSRSKALSMAQKLRGKLDLKINLDVSRERTNR